MLTQGIRRDETTSGDKYFMRALLLVRAEWQIFAAGLLCLCVYNGISLAMPTVQGQWGCKLSGTQYTKINCACIRVDTKRRGGAEPQSLHALD